MTYAAFPYTRLPKPMADIVHYGAKAIGCDHSFLALPALCACAGLIGGSRRLQAKRNWLVPPILWGCVLGESGSQKSPAMDLILGPLRERNKHENAAYEAAKQTAEHVKGQPPTMKRSIVSDTTTEALALIARENPRGLILERDELAGVLGGFNQYKNGKGADEAFYLSAFDGRSFTSDRKKGREYIYVPSVSLSIIGTCQPGVFSSLMGQKQRESGLLARFLIVMPPTKAKHWTEAEVNVEVEAGWADVLNALAALEMTEDAQGKPIPIVIPLAAAAKKQFQTFYDSHNLTLDTETDAWRSFLAKAEQLPLRLALILHHVRWAGGEKIDVSEVGADTMRNAIDLTKWFIREGERVYGQLNMTEEERKRDRLEQWIRGQGGRSTVRNISRGPREFRLGEAEVNRLCEMLVKRNCARWATTGAGEIGGAPKREIVLV